MLKKLGVLLLVVLFAACQSDTEPQQQTADQPPQDPMMQEQQPMADADVSDDELETFVEVNINFQETQMGAQEEMMGILEEEEISIENYNQIAQGMQMGQSEEDLEVSSDEIDKFERASERVAEIEERLDAEFEEAVAASGMDSERFMEINMMIQQNPELMQRVQQMIQQEGGMEGQQQQPPADEF